MIEVSRLKDLNAAKLFLGFRIGAISRRDFAVFPVQGQRGLRRLKRYMYFTVLLLLVGAGTALPAGSFIL